MIRILLITIILFFRFFNFLFFFSFIYIQNIYVMRVQEYNINKNTVTQHIFKYATLIFNYI